MSCRKDGKPCDPESLVCRLNPEAGEQTFRSIDVLEDRAFPNKKCSNFRKTVEAEK